MIQGHTNKKEPSHAYIIDEFRNLGLIQYSFHIMKTYVKQLLSHTFVKNIHLQTSYNNIQDMRNTKLD